MITLNFKKGKKTPGFFTSLQVMLNTYFRLLLKGRIKLTVYYPTSALYETDKTDQADVLKLIGFKNLISVKPEGVSYRVSKFERMIGWRRVNSTDEFLEFGIHERINGKRTKFYDNPVTKVKPHDYVTLPEFGEGFKWYHFPVAPWFGGDDSNNDGLGGEAPQDVTIKIRFE